MARRVRTPLILQLEAAECGAAALGMVMGYYGRYVPLTDLRQQCGVSRDGSKASRIVAAARSYDMDSHGYAYPPEDLYHVEPPYVVYWQFDHFLVVEGLTEHRAYLNDPAVGHRTIPLSEFREHYSGVALTFRPGPEFRKGGRPPRLLPLLWTRLRGHGVSILYGLLAGLLMVLPAMAMPVFGAVFIDMVLVKKLGNDWLRPILWLLAVTVVVNTILYVLDLRVLRRLQLAMTARLASQFFWHLLRLPMSFYLQRFAGEIGSRQDLTVQVASILSGKLVGTMLALTTLGLYAAILGVISWPLTLIGVGVTLIEAMALWAVYRPRREAALRHTRDLGRAAGIAIAGLQGIEALKATGLETGFFARWVGHYSRAADAEQKLEQTTLATAALPELLDTLTATLLLIVGGGLVMGGKMTLGTLVAFQGLLHKMLDPMAQLVRLAGSLQELEADMFRLDDVLTYPPIADCGLRIADSGQSAIPPPLEQPKLTGRVELRQLTFGYSPLEPPFIDGFNLTVEPGRRVALVGASGSGKSTVVRLLAGLYVPKSGQVLLDGRPRDEWPSDVVANSVALVDQDILLFEATVRANLTLWDRTLTEEQLWNAARDACIADVIRALPGGLDAELREAGANLSAGQRQRVEIARALAAEPTVLILDEATSALDTATEAEVMNNLRRRGCTCILAAHRLSTIRDCDEILVFKGGRIVERGPHDQLWAARGEYARLLESEES